ncbi:MAG: glycerol-3-phosphate dehydrogenase/oxidase [ANME-2 cluster archaeon]|nr:glycerol-3-phosphate dehydrogenase/oxidase [ANME-2 cluster archaeon]
MKRDTARLFNKKYDVLIIGGGIYGATAAWDAASRGLSVALLDKYDFGSKNSSNSQKTIHGGLRYIQHGDFKRMRESICERTNLMRTAPHLVHPMPCIIPTYGRIMRLIMPIALKVFDLASYDRNRLNDPQKHIPNGKTISKEECLRLIPGLREEGLTGASIWYDSQAYNTERLLISFIRSAVQSGADVANYLEVTGFLKDENRITGVKAKDLLTDEELEIQAKVVLNTSGPWVDDVLSFVGTPFNRKVNLSIMRLIVVNRVFVKDYAFGVKFQKTFKDEDAIINKGYRLLFISPWRDYSLIGTAQEPYQGDLNKFTTTESDIHRLIEEVNEAYPQAALTRKDVTFFYQGLIPIDEIDSNGDVTISKSNRIYDSKNEGIDGLISIVSVKYTTARNTAQTAIDMIYKNLGKKPPQCTTMDTPIYGGNIERFNDFLNNAIKNRPKELDEGTIRNLVYNYGSEYKSVLKYLDEDPGYGRRINDISHVIEAEIIHGVREEMALKLSDVILRRTELGTAEYPGDEGLETSARIMARELGWDESRIQEEIEDVRSIYTPAIDQV